MKVTTHGSTVRFCFSLLLVLLSLADAYGVNRCVLLKNGNVLRGETQQLANEVVVQSSTATVRLPVDDVEFVANSIGDIYAYKSRRTSKRPTARAALVRWCVKHDLISEAQRELTQLKKLSPSYPGLAVLQQNLQRHRTNTGSPRSKKKTVLPSGSPLHPDLQYAVDRRDQISKDSMRDFVRTVQPLLLNRCALAGCHGKATQSSYQLVGGRSSMSQGLTHRNLGATLQRITSPTEHSLLWQAASLPHGGAQQVLQKDEQVKLYQWLSHASSELATNVGANQMSVAKQVTPVFAADGSDPFDPAEFNSLFTSK